MVLDSRGKVIKAVNCENITVRAVFFYIAVVRALFIVHHCFCNGGQVPIFMEKCNA